jgi:hypothetical protein
MKLIHFQDNGQDYLRWLVTDEGMVVDCQPFQAKVWVGAKVLNHHIIKPEAELYVRLQDGHEMTIRHLVERVDFVHAPAKKRATRCPYQPIDFSGMEAF